MGTLAVLDEVRMERAAQVLRWGGSQHDDEHGPRDWIAFIVKQLGGASGAETAAEYRRRMVNVAALAVAAIESLDRLDQREPTP